MLKYLAIIGAVIAALLAILIALIVKEAHYYTRTTLDLESFLFARITSYVAWIMNVKVYPRNDSKNAEYVRDLLKNSSVEYPQQLKDLPFLDVKTEIYGTEVANGKHHIMRIMKKEPKDSLLPALLFLHGGCWSVGSLDAAHEVCARLSNETQMIVFCAAYRQAPEYPFPTPFYDAYSSLQWIHQHGTKYGADTEHIYIVGESAGGNLAAAITAYNLDITYIPIEQRIPIRGLVLIYPPLEVNFKTLSYIEYDQMTGFLTATQSEYMWNMYATNHIEQFNRNNYTFTPINTPISILKEFPHTVVVLAKYDVLFDDGVNFAKKLQSVGVNTDLLIFNSTVHGFFGKQSFPVGTKSVKWTIDLLLNKTSSVG